MMTDSHVCKQLAHGFTQQRRGRYSNPRPVDRKSHSILRTEATKQKGSVKESEFVPHYKIEKITRSDTAENLHYYNELFGSVARDRYARQRI